MLDAPQTSSLGSGRVEPSKGGQSRLLRLFEEFDTTGRMSIEKFKSELEKIVTHGKAVPITPSLTRLIETEGRAGTMTYAAIISALESVNPDRRRADLPLYKLDEVRPQPALPPRRDPVKWDSGQTRLYSDSEIRQSVADIIDGRLPMREFAKRLRDSRIGIDGNIETLLRRHQGDPSGTKFSELVAAIIRKRDTSQDGKSVMKIQAPYAVDDGSQQSRVGACEKDYPHDIIANLGSRGGEFTRELNTNRRGNSRSSGAILAWDRSTSDTQEFSCSDRVKSIRSLPVSSDVLRYCREPSGEDMDDSGVVTGGRRRVRVSSKSTPPFGTEADISNA
ncbi:hypothetical protein FOL47_009078 [Perkinsus chesapeaki]|uniref:Uncharacterized protein n=1 Tax=Perkinsus chesapeaki TaxID=330153 RepID=A0A7J6MSJ8_PERCH|nr:hypothetical protein FOL47_009078 [Perkinsus chesapeaki]